MEFRYIQYIGRKPIKRDNLYQTGVVWNGYGDIQPVAADVAPRLLAHTDAYAEVDRETYEAYREQADQHGIDTAALERARERVAAGGAVTTDGSAETTAGEGEGGGSEGEDGSDSGNPDGGGLSDADTGEGEGESGGGESAGEDDGEGEQERPPQKPEKPVSQLGKSKLAEYADREFGETLDVANMEVEDVRNQVRQLMAEHGVK